MSDWKEYKFSELLVDDSISYGIVQPGAHTEIDSVPIVRVNNIKNGYIETGDAIKVTASIEEKYKRTRLVGGELLITVVGSVGECAIVPESLKGWNVARAVSVARIKENVNKYFIKYSFQTDDIRHQLYGNTNDTVQPTLNLGSLKKIKFLLPSLTEQTAIAEVLSSLDDKIDLLHRQNKTLEQLAETLFRQWFVEEADESWKVEKLGEVAIVQNGYAFSRKDYVLFQDGHLEVLKMGHIAVGGGLRTNPKKDFVPRQEKFKKWTLNKNDIVMGMTDMKDNVVILGVPAMIDKSEKYVLNQRVARIYLESNKKLLNSYLLFIQLKNKEFIATLQSKANSGVQVNLSTEVIKDCDILIPPMELQKEKGNAIAELYLKRENNQIQIKTLTQLRDTLLPKLMSGEVRVK